MTAVLDSLSYADIAAYTVVLLVTVATLGALWLLGRCTLRTCAAWALCLLLPLTACTLTAAPSDAVKMRRSGFDTTGIEDGAAWGGVVLFTGWWEEPT